MTTGSSPSLGAKVALLLSAAGLPLFNSRSATSLRERSLGTLGRSIFAQPERGFLEIAALRPTPSQSRPLASPCWSGRRPATRSAENDQIRSLLALEPFDESLPRGPPPHRKVTQERERPPTLIPRLSKRGGRSFGAALSEVAIVTTPTSSAGLATGQAMSRSPIGGSPVPGLAAALWCSRYALRGL